VTKNFSNRQPTGEYYREFLLPFLSKAEYKVIIPMEGKSIGKQLQC